MAENKSIGALWQKEKFLSGEIEIDGKKTKLIVFKNDHKSEDKHPDYRIFISKPKHSDGRMGEPLPDEISDVEPF